MAKLAKSKANGSVENSAAEKQEAWNPATSVSTPSSQKLMPPPARPPTGQVFQAANAGNAGDTPASAKRKRRKRSKKSGRDSFSENATTISEDTTNNPPSSPWRKQSTASSQAVRPSMEGLRPTISQEEQPVFEQEPEMFGVYASSSEDDAWGSTKRHRNGTLKRAHTYSPSVAEAAEEPANDKSLVKGGASGAGRPQVTLRVQLAQLAAASGSQKMANDRYPCPLKAEFTCDKTFGNSRAARRHADLHVNADKFRCDTCAKGYSRKDLYERHLKSHSSGTADSFAKQGDSTKPAASGSAAVHAQVGNTISQVGGTDDTYPTIPSSLMPAEPPGNVTSAESETESEEELADETTDTTTSTNDAKSDAAGGRGENPDELMENASDEDETVATSEEPEQNISPVKSRASPTRAPAAQENVLKRKWPSPPSEQSSAAAAASPSRKRARRKEASLELEPEPRHEIRDQHDSSTSSASSDASSEESEADMEIGDRQQESESESSRSLTDEEEQSQLPVRQKGPGKFVQERIRPESSKWKATEKAAPAHPPSGRQSSLDDFIQRSEPVDAPVRASSSRIKEVVVNVPPKRQQKLLTQEKPQSRKRKLDALEDGKGKGRARNGDEEGDDSDDQIDDKPRATTAARRATKAKGRASIKSRQTNQKGKKAAPSSSNESDADASGVENGKQSSRQSHASGIETEGPTSGRTGKFTDTEITTLLSWRDNFCVEHNMSHREFNDMMTASMRRDKSSWPFKSITRKEFLQQYYEQLPHRNRRSMTRFRERHFQNVNNNPWTEEEDEELRSLVQQLGTKWVEIGQLMERTQDQVSQRWRHKLNYGQDIETGNWSPEDILKLEQEVEAYAQSKGMAADDDNLTIPWHAISVKVGNGRTPQQCSNRWRVSTTRRIGGKFVKIGPDERGSGTAKKAPKTPNKTAKRLAGDTGEKPRTSTRLKPKAKKELNGSAKIAAKSEPASSAKLNAAKKVSQPKKQFKSAERIDDSDDEEGSRNANKDAASEDDEEVLETPGVSGTESDSSDSEQESEGHESGSDKENSEPKNSSQDASQPDPSESDSSTSPPPQTSRRKAQTAKPSSQAQSPKSIQTPLLSKNPLKGAKTPANALSLTQLHEGTQADSSAKRTTTGRRSHVPDSVIEERPSPRLSVRKRALRSSSPLGGMLEEHLEESQEAKSPLDDSFVSARSESRDQSQGEDERRSGSDSNSEGTIDSGSGGEGSASASGSDEESDAEDQMQPTASQGMFWQSVNMLRNLVPGSSQATPVQTQGKKGRSLADALTRGNAVGDDSDSSDE